MSDDRENDARPAKRARLDDSATHTPSAAPPQATPGSARNAPSQIETDYEKEVRAGITEYITPENLGFTGILKQRYTDFLVNEIGLDGKVLHLKSTQPEKRKKDVKTEEQESVVRPEEKIEIREETEKRAGSAPAPVAPLKEKPVEVQPVAKTEAANDGEETFAVASTPKKEAKEEVRIFQCIEQGVVLTMNSFPRTTQSSCTRSSARKRPHRSSRSFRAYGTAKKRKQEASSLSRQHRSSIKRHAPTRTNRSVAYSRISLRRRWRTISRYGSKPTLRLSVKAKAEEETAPTGIMRNTAVVSWRGKS